MAEILEAEQRKTTFDLSELQRFFYFNSEKITQKMNEGFADFSANPKLVTDMNFFSKSRFEQMKDSAMVLQELNSSNDQKYNYNRKLTMIIADFQFPFTLPTGVSQLMFIPTIQFLGTDEQCKKWIPRSQSYEIIGCYCQTELGHGSDVQGLETTAEYDPKTQTFIINSPTVSSTKWWVGELGVWSNHALVFAQLHILGKKHGVHPIIV